MSVFEHYSKYYDLLYKGKDYQSEIKYIDSLINKYAPHTQSILEMGCGTGRHAMLLSDKGYQIYGIDKSDEMLKEAKSRMNNLSPEKARRIKFAKGDVRFYRASKRFDTVISLFHVISYQVTNEDLINTFNTAKHHLNKDGVFVFDCWYGPAVISEKPQKRVKKIEDDKIVVTRIAEPIIHATQNCVDVNYTIFVHDKIVKKSETIKESHKMRYLFGPELDMIAANCGLKIIAQEEWMTGKEPGFDSWGVCFIAINHS